MRWSLIALLFALGCGAPEGPSPEEPSDGGADGALPDYFFPYYAGSVWQYDVAGAQKATVRVLEVNRVTTVGPANEIVPTTVAKLRMSIGCSTPEVFVRHLGPN